MAPGVPGYILEPKLTRARKEIFGYKALPKKSQARYMQAERGRRVLEQVAMATEFLHFKRLVHMELSLDTVMLREGGDHVVLINPGAPRRADLPTRPENTETKEYVYLAPEVLNGGIYRSQADVYALGLMAWEIWTQEFVFAAQRNAPLNEFTADAAQIQCDAMNPFLDVIARCALPPADARMNSTDVVNTLRAMKVISVEVLDDDED